MTTTRVNLFTVAATPSKFLSKLINLDILTISEKFCNTSAARSFHVYIYLFEFHVGYGTLFAYVSDLVEGKLTLALRSYDIFLMSIEDSISCTPKSNEAVNKACVHCHVWSINAEQDFLTNSY